MLGNWTGVSSMQGKLHNPCNVSLISQKILDMGEESLGTQKDGEVSPHPISEQQFRLLLTEPQKEIQRFPSLQLGFSPPPPAPSTEF